MTATAKERAGSPPFFVIAMAIGSSAMLVPALHAATREDWFTARVFFYGMILGMMLTAIIGLATYGRQDRRGVVAPAAQLIGLAGAYLILPAMFAAPFAVAAGSDFGNGWYEMIAAFTTTGGTVFDNVGRLSPSLHLWRALVGWLGGLMVWVSAAAILAPMNLGGFEVRAASAARLSGAAGRLIPQARAVSAGGRITRLALLLTPIYAGLTGLLWMGLLIAGEVPIVAATHAMSVLSTSGISPLVGGARHAASGVVGEVMMAVFMVFALSRVTFSRRQVTLSGNRLWGDPELSTALVIVIVVPALLFLRHFLAATGTDEAGQGGLWAGLSALWGGFFTTLSFLTTTGFESSEWAQVQHWSGLKSEGLILMGLATFGGGVATTAGGVKLLRMYALYKHGARELGRLIHPSSVGGAGAEARRIRREGAFIAWIMFMLFAISVTAVMLLLAAFGVQFETAMIVAVAALANCAPVAEIAGQYPISFEGLPGAAKTVLALAMVLGRLESLAIIALFNPAVWRR